MATNGNEKERVIVVLSLSGGNDGLNTLIPYSNPTYYDYRNTLGISEDQVIRINDEVGFPPQHDRVEGDIRPGEHGSDTGRRLPEPQPLPLPLHGQSGTPASLTQSAARDGWDAPFATWTPTMRTCSQA